jgi:AcrR family transcriptional regulator
MPPETPAPARPLNKRQQQAAETRERMLAAAREVFETKGYQAASVATITKAAETAHGTFYLYFKNRDDAFAQVIADVVEEMLDESRARVSDDRYANLEGMIAGVVVVFARHAGLWRCLLEGMMQSPAIEEIWLWITKEFTDRISHRIEREQEAGLIRGIDALETAEALSSMTQWYGFRKLVSQRSTPSDEDVQDTITVLTDLWYHALYGTTDRA